MIDGYKTVNQVAEEWGVNPRTIQAMCSDGKIEGATKFGNVWAIPADAVRPADHRVNKGAYRGWRKKYTTKELPANELSKQITRE